MLPDAGGVQAVSSWSTARRLRWVPKSPGGPLPVLAQSCVDRVDAEDWKLPMPVPSLHSYDPRMVAAHGDELASVMLMNEAPGPDEADGGIPLFGQQGANLYHAFRKADVAWAAAHGTFVWPKTSNAPADRLAKKLAFLSSRAKHITCTNSYAQWPKSEADGRGFAPPAAVDVLSTANLARIQAEVRPSHRVVLLCGANAYLACCGEALTNPQPREGTDLTEAELDRVNKRLGSAFEAGWYLGHTRRWNMHQASIRDALQRVAAQAGWTAPAAEA